MNPHLQRASLLLEQSRYDLAEKEIRKAMTIDPDDAMAHALLGLCLTKLEKFDEGQREAETAIHLAPDEPFVFYVHSIVLAGRNLHKEAKQAIETAIGLDPYDPHYFGQLAQIELGLRNWKQAEEAANEGLSLDPEDVSCTNLRAIALVKQGKNIEAQTAIDSALQKSPEDDASHANMGWSLLEQNKPEKAMEHFREALRLNPEMEWARLGIIEAMKARYFIYRWMLNWFLWMSKLQQKAQVGVIFGAYIGFQVLRRVANANPALAPFLQPLLIAYVVFAIMTWLSSPLFNLVLRTSKFGRLALSKEEIRTSTWVGMCAMLALGMVVTFFLTGTIEFLGAGLCFVLVIPPITRIYACEEGWPRNTLTLIAAGLLGVGLYIVTCLLVGHFIGGRQGDILIGSALVFFLPFVYTSVAAQFGVGFLTSAHPKRGSDSGRMVWIVGGILLSVLALGMVGFTGLALIGGSAPDPALFEMPVTASPMAINAPNWTDAEQIQKDTAYAQEEGFQLIGDFQLKDYEYETNRILLNEEDGIYIELIDDIRIGHMYTISSIYEDGSQFTYSQTPFEGIKSRPNTTVRNFSLELQESLPRFRSERPQQGIRKIAANEVEAVLIKNYDEDMSYLLRRGGPSAEEFLAVAESSGAPISESRATRFKRVWQSQASEAVRKHVVESLLAAEQIQPHEADQVICVHSLLSGNDLSNLLRDERLTWKNRAGPSALKVSDALAERDDDPRSMIASFFEKEDQVRHLKTLDNPLPTDVWILNTE